VGTAKERQFSPPSPERVPGLLEALLIWWRQLHPQLTSADKETVISALADLHHRFLAIHPFLDANGRIARILIDQAAVELLNQRIGRELTSDLSSYFSALKAADSGDLEPLIEIIEASLI
jgi:Fic family protein